MVDNSAAPGSDKRDPANASLRESIDSVKAALQGSIIDDPTVQQLIFQQILALIKSWFAKKKDPVLPDPIVVAPKPPDSVPVPAPAPSNPYAKVPSALALRIKGVKRNGVHISDAEVKNVRDGSDPVNVNGDVVNLDLNPIDEHGEEIFQGSQALEGLLVDPSFGTYLNVGDSMTYRYDKNGAAYPTGKPWPGGYDNHRVHHIVTGPADQGGEYRNFGCGVNINPTDNGVITVRAECTRADGVKVTSNAVTFRAKSW